MSLHNFATRVGGKSYMWTIFNSNSRCGLAATFLVVLLVHPGASQDPLVAIAGDSQDVLVDGAGVAHDPQGEIAEVSHDAPAEGAGGSHDPLAEGVEAPHSLVESAEVPHDSLGALVEGGRSLP